jgi:folate-binding Fe-S cluster repair protein YgfZ
MIKAALNKAFKLSNLNNLNNLNNVKKLQYSTQISNKCCNLASQSYLKLEGVDQISFLQGMTTNHIKNWFDKAEDKIIYTGILSPQVYNF